MSDNRWMPYVLGSMTGLALGLALLLVAYTRGLGPFERGDGVEEAREAPVELVSETPEPAPIDSAPASSDDAVSQDRRGALVAATRKASPAVVSVVALHRQDVRRYRTLYDEMVDMFSPGSGRTFVQRRFWEGRGSGVIVDQRGHVVTNDHVLGEDPELFVILSDGRQFSALVVGRAPDYDLALLRIDEATADLPVADLGDSDDLETGQWAIAIGNPYGTLLDDPQPTVTVGVISALHRDFVSQDGDGREYLDMIQTDASINPGNSGGALVNAQGQLIGINTFIISGRGGGSIGLGFAVPINRVRWIKEEILRHGEVRPRYFGFQARLLDAFLRQSHSLPEDLEGLLITAVNQGGPADRAGLQPLDVIRAIDGVAIRDRSDINRQIYEARVGSELRFEVLRRGQALHVEITLGERPRQNDSSGR